MAPLVGVNDPLADQSTVQLIATPTPNPPRRMNLHQLHSDRIPIQTYPLPVLTLHNSITAIRCLYIILSQTFFSSPIESSQSAKPIYQGYFSPTTRTIHVTDEQMVRGLWERGFFGKGSLSRSEPAWLEKEKRRIAGARTKSGMTSEEVTRKRREERQKFKMERAKAQADAVRDQLRLERGDAVEEGDKENEGQALEVERSEGSENQLSVVGDSQGVLSEKPANLGGGISQRKEISGISKDVTDSVSSLESKKPHPTPDDRVALSHEQILENQEPEIVVENKEHLDVTLEEAFFLTYALGVLDIHCTPGICSELGIKLVDDGTNADTPDPRTWLHAPNHTFALLSLFRSASYPSPRSTAESLTTNLRPDDPFLLRYVSYHHFRSLGWVVREGVKFGVDYLLYYKGPAFSHAQFAVVIVPRYPDPAWEEKDEAGEIKEGRVYKERDWWWLHCVNRVQAHVYKTLVLAYVNVPSPKKVEACGQDVGKILKEYSIREFCVRRWVPNRNRD